LEIRKRNVLKLTIIVNLGIFKDLITKFLVRQARITSFIVILTMIYNNICVHLHSFEIKCTFMLVWCGKIKFPHRLFYMLIAANIVFSFTNRRCMSVLVFIDVRIDVNYSYIYNISYYCIWLVGPNL